MKIDDVKCSLCGDKDETIHHLFIECRLIQDSKQRLENRCKVRTLGEEEILFHEGRLKMRNKHLSESVAAFKHAIWKTRAKLFYGAILTEAEVQTTLYSLLLDSVKLI